MSDDFSALLQALNSGDNDIRQKAEDKYASLDAKQKLQLLVPASADGQLQDRHSNTADIKYMYIVHWYPSSRTSV